MVCAKLSCVPDLINALYRFADLSCLSARVGKQNRCFLHGSLALDNSKGYFFSYLVFLLQMAEQAPAGLRALAEGL